MVALLRGRNALVVLLSSPGPLPEPLPDLVSKIFIHFHNTCFIFRFSTSIFFFSATPTKTDAAPQVEKPFVEAAAHAAPSATVRAAPASGQKAGTGRESRVGKNWNKYAFFYARGFALSRSF